MKQDQISPFSKQTLFDRIVCGRWVAREREMTEVLALWQRAAAGEGQVLVVSGEPGIGKTRIVQELAARAQTQGARILVGECYAEGGPPYAPIAEIIRDSLEHPGWAEVELSDPTLAALRTLSPALRTHYPNVPPNPGLDPQSEQQRLFDSLVEWCTALSARAPILLFVDDVHWADSGTLFLLRHLARRGRKLPLLIVLTFRESEQEESRALTDVLLDLNRERVVTQIRLRRLSREETRELLEAMLAEAVADEFLDSIYSQTEGNPFFIEEVCKGLVEEALLSYQEGRWQRASMSEITIPHTVRAAIQQRVRKLPVSAQETLRLAAILGREFDFEILKQTSDLDEETLLASLESAVRTQLIVEVSGSRAEAARFAFVHVLIPTTLREDVIRVRRQRLHLRAAVAIHALHPDDFEALAYHYAEAGDAERAREHYRYAGDRAQQAAPGDAVRLYREALARWSDTDPAGRADTLSKLGYCLWITGDVPEAQKCYEAAYNLFEAVGSRTQRGETQRMIGRMYWEQANRQASLEHYHRALEILEQGPETVELAGAISSISQMHMLAHEVDQALAWGKRALEMGQRLGAEEVIIDALNNIGTTLCDGGDFIKGTELLQESLARAIAINSTPEVFRAHYNLIVMLQRQCHYAEAQTHMEQFYAYATQVYARNYANVALWRLMWIKWLTGQWSAALSYRAQIGEFSNSLYSTWTKRVFAMMDLDLGRIDQASDELEGSWPNALWANDMQTTIPYLGQLVRAYAARGQEAKTAETVEHMLGLVAGVSHEFIIPLFIACQWLASQNTHNSLEKAHACLSHLEKHVEPFGTGEAAAALAEARGRVALAEAQPREGVEHFRQAAGKWASIGHPYDQARALGGLGSALGAAGESAAARTANEEALELLNRLAVQLDPELQALFLDSHLVREIRDQVEAFPRATARELAKQEFGGLTVRERQVATLVAHGRPNRAIAEQLVVTERTVEKHIENIMSKLGFNSRAQIAVWAVESGLAKSKDSAGE